jgi:hypothetical protein
MHLTQGLIGAEGSAIGSVEYRRRAYREAPKGILIDGPALASLCYEALAAAELGLAKAAEVVLDPECHGIFRDGTNPLRAIANGKRALCIMKDALIAQHRDQLPLNYPPDEHLWSHLDTLVPPNREVLESYRSNWARDRTSQL